MFVCLFVCWFVCFYCMLLVFLMLSLFVLVVLIALEKFIFVSEFKLLMLLMPFTLFIYCL